MYDRFRECLDQLRQFTAELTTIRMVLEQQIETLEKMSDVVCRFQLTELALLCISNIKSLAGECLFPSGEHHGHPPRRQHPAFDIYQYCGCLYLSAAVLANVEVRYTSL